MTDLSTTYLGLRLKNPLVASASPLCEEVDNIRPSEDAGVLGMPVMGSLNGVSTGGQAAIPG